MPSRVAPPPAARPLAPPMLADADADGAEVGHAAGGGGLLLDQRYHLDSADREVVPRGELGVDVQPCECAEHGVPVIH